MSERKLRNGDESPSFRPIVELDESANDGKNLNLAQVSASELRRLCLELNKEKMNITASFEEKVEELTRSKDEIQRRFSAKSKEYEERINFLNYGVQNQRNILSINLAR